MKQFIKFVAGMLAVSFLAVCMISCSNDSSDSNDNPTTELTTLDLRIKKGGTAYAASNTTSTANVARSVEVNTDKDLWNEEITSSTYCSVDNVEGGLKFTIKKPNTGYTDGFGYLAIYRVEKINGEQTETTKAVLPWGIEDDEYTCIYPLCEPDEHYVFKVQMEPKEVDRDSQRYEWLSIVAEDGIGDIDYSGIKDSRHCTMTYDGTKPTLNLVDCIAPINAKNLTKNITFFLSDATIDWTKTNATVWVREYSEAYDADAEDSFKTVVENFTDYDGVTLISFNTLMETTNQDINKTHFFGEYYFGFTVDEGSGIDSWGTGVVRSPIVSFQ